MKDKKLHTTNLDFSHESDAGMCFNMVCPNCEERVLVAESAFWDEICKCGIQWTLNISVTGKQIS